jgi:hypothetical protein
MDPFSAVKGKCTWWREVPRDEDEHDVTLKADQWRVECACFVEGYRWEFVVPEVPKECPRANSCRYYIVSR